jgi:hypothetical protein
MTVVFLLHHVHEFDDGHEDVKLVGVYSTQSKAEAALATVRDQPGFRDLPDGFSIDEWEVDRARPEWPQGFATVLPGEEF